MSHKVAVIGLGLFGSTLARALAARGVEVIAIDSSMSLVEEIQNDVPLAVRLDATDETALKDNGVGTVDTAVVTIGQDFEAVQLATMYCKQLGATRVIARATSDMRERILKLIGADEVINPEDAAAKQLAQRLASPNLVGFLQLAEGHSVVEMKTPSAFHDKTIADLALRQKYRVNLVAIRREVEGEGEEATITVNVLPIPSDPIQEGDTLVLVGADDAIAALPS